MVKRYLRRYPKEKRRTRRSGPNCAGVISPGKAMLGIMPGHIYKRGTVGLVDPLGHAGLRGRLADEGARHRHHAPASASAATRSTAARSWTSCSCSRRIPRPRRS